MLTFPNAKINLGLNIVEKRSDGFHNIETVFFPVSWLDALEVVENREWKKNDPLCLLHLSGIPVEGDPGDNLVVKAYQLIHSLRPLPPVSVYLHKKIPMGAGLGGGSSDAAFFIRLINQQFELRLTDAQMKTEASKLGSDCAFFIENKPIFASGKGDQFRAIDISLKGYKLIIVYPGLHSNTKLAYSRVVPKQPEHDLLSVVSGNVSDWKHTLKNDFEESVFTHFPEIKKLKEDLYASGAEYASLSGSGSSVFALFRADVPVSLQFHSSCLVHEYVI